MRVRRLSTDGDMQFGGGQAAFWRDVPDAPAQCAVTRLALWEGQWWFDRREGTKWRTRVLGKRTVDTRDATIRSRLLGTEGVKAIAAYSSALDRETRRFVVSATLDTTYGRIAIVEPV